MSNIETLIPEQPYTSIYPEDSNDQRIYWCYMHAHWKSAGFRPCFSELLLNDLLRWQKNLANKVRLSSARQDTIAHLVLASEADVFNLGGDLELFTQLIRSRNRDRLLRYARLCVDVAYRFQNTANGNIRSIALVQGDALGGGFEAALSCHTIVAEEGVGMGLPEVLFDLFPGMGAYSYLCRRVSPAQAERMMLDGNVYSSEELHRMGIVDVLAPKGQGRDAVMDVIRRNRNISHAHQAMHQVRNMVQPVTYDELMRITEVWVDTALKLGEKSLRTMERLVRAQVRRSCQQQILPKAS